ncbi:unnamed protein product [Acanthoscelides obtectus]|uniref:Tubulin-specific chaperone E n=1 Tax=Acanthoscelides obtectus TaxID=200917 RepID=A0A9P0LSZ0_ACAOB|nr:unnamed protein product [Acanthoscelides obtectus]CAK1668443.1 Tubulin-specific chaperone E [Acanthoscelides obtectus]
MISNSTANQEMVAEATVPQCNFKIGSRVECCSYIGTVKYIGPVEGHQGTWLGIDWDDSTRGKHNGTVNGVEYFHTWHPKSGSFVRKEKVTFGQSLIQAIKSRYGCVEDDTTAKLNEQTMLKFQQDINAPFLQLVGFDKVADKQRDFNSLQVVSVRSMNVNGIGEASNELKRLFPNIREIDLSRSLLSSWTDVFSICAQLDSLSLLNVSENILELPLNYEKYKFPQISMLVCGQMHLNWANVKKLAQVFPSIKELRVPYNNITDLSTPKENNFKDLQTLDLDGNDIRLWSKVNKLKAIRNLKHLIVENIKLQSIQFEEDNTPIDDFPNLNILNINENQISEWRSIAELNKLRNLEHLRILKNPILETEKFETRIEIIIAKIKNLKTINGSTIKREERYGAEIDYLKKYALEWIDVQNNPEARSKFLLEHNRYLELIESKYEIGGPGIFFVA